MKHSSKQMSKTYSMQTPQWCSTMLCCLFAFIPFGAQAMTAGTVLTMTAGTCPNSNTSGPPPTGLGSCFGMEVTPGFVIQTNISGYNGIIIGVKQSSLLFDGTRTVHGGLPDGTEILGVDNAWQFFGSTGLHQMTVAPTELTANTVLDFSGWNVSWNNVPSINMGTNAHSGYTNGQAQITCSPTPCANGSTYTMAYTATVPNGDPSGFGNVKYGLRLEGTVVVPSTLSTDATSLGVGSCATTVSSADGRLSEANLTTCSIALDSNISTANYNTRLFYDFTVNIGGSPGGNARVVIPLSAHLPANTIFRIYKTATSTWATFTEDSNNIVASAAGSLGTCPAAGSASYVSPATKGHYCLQLTIQDNGVNDNNTTLGAIAARGGVASGVTIVNVDTRAGSTGGCSIGRYSKDGWGRGDWWMVFVFVMWLGAIATYRRRPQRDA